MYSSRHWAVYIVLYEKLKDKKTRVEDKMVGTIIVVVGFIFVLHSFLRTDLNQRLSYIKGRYLQGVRLNVDWYQS